jgi:hypothetical protein
VQVAARDSLLDHVWADVLTCLKALGKAPLSNRSSSAAAEGQRGGQAGDAQDWDLSLCQERCLRSVSEVKATVVQQQVCLPRPKALALVLLCSR